MFNISGNPDSEETTIQFQDVVLEPDMAIIFTKTLKSLTKGHFIVINFLKCRLKSLNTSLIKFLPLTSLFEQNIVFEFSLNYTKLAILPIKGYVGKRK